MNILSNPAALERAVIYARVSGDDTKKESRNIEGQLDMGRDHCQEKGYRIVDELYEDPKKHTSGHEIDLPILNRIRDMARASEFDVLVVRELDRLSRNLAKQLIVEEELNRAGVRIEYVLTEYDDSPEGRLSKHIRATIAEFEREKIKERLTRGVLNKVKSGSVFVSGRPPYGYSLAKVGDKFTLEIDETEARIIRLIFQWYIVGENGRTLTAHEIRARLSELGVPSPFDTQKRSGKKIKKRGEWSFSTVARILRSEVYAGIWYFKKTARSGRRLTCTPKENHIPVGVPAIVSRETWNLAQRRIDQNKLGAKRNTKYEYLLARRITCGGCGYKMGGTRAGKFLYYYCPSANADCPRECHNPHTFRADKVDAKVWEWVRGFFEDEELLEAGIKRYRERNESETAPLRERVRVIDDLVKQREKELGEMQRDYRAMKNSAAKRTKATLLKDIEDAEKTLDNLEAQRAETLAALEQATLSEQDLRAIRDYAAEVRQGLDIANASFPERRWLIERLSVKVTLTIEDGQRIAYVTCTLGEDEPKRLLIDSHTSK